jgi:hypothetical protein
MIAAYSFRSSRRTPTTLNVRASGGVRSATGPTRARTGLRQPGLRTNRRTIAPPKTAMIFAAIFP